MSSESERQTIPSSLQRIWMRTKVFFNCQLYQHFQISYINRMKAQPVRYFIPRWWSGWPWSAPACWWPPPSSSTPSWRQGMTTTGLSCRRPTADFTLNLLQLWCCDENGIVEEIYLLKACGPVMVVTGWWGILYFFMIYTILRSFLFSMFEIFDCNKL